MRYGILTGLAVAGLAVAIAGARAEDQSKYPDWKGQWNRFAVPLPTQPSHDQTKPWGRGQEAPLTPEYQAVLEASIADQANGGLGNFPTTTGRPAGMPHMMMAFRPLEFVVTPDTTYILIGSLRPLSPHFHRRPRMAEGHRADLCGLFDRQVGRYGRRRPL